MICRRLSFILFKKEKGILKKGKESILRIHLKSYDHALVDKACVSIIETAKRLGVDIVGPVPMPTKKEVITILRAVHKYKDSREQFEMRTHKRLIDILRPTTKFMEALQGLNISAGVELQVKYGGPNTAEKKQTS